MEVVLEMFLEGISLSEMETMMAVARLESGGQLVGPLEQDIMLSWSAMVFLTLQAIGLPLRPSGVSYLSQITQTWDPSTAASDHLETGVGSEIGPSLSPLLEDALWCSTISTHIQDLGGRMDCMCCHLTMNYRKQGGKEPRQYHCRSDGAGYGVLENILR